MLYTAMEPGRELDHNPVDLAHERPTIIGPVVIEPSLRRISANGVVRNLEPKVMQVLVALMRDEERILSRDDLIDVCWKGTIVGDASINRVISLLRSSLRDVAGDQVVIETVPKVGYRLLVHEENRDVVTGSSQGASQVRRYLILVVGLVIVLLGAAAFYNLQRPAHSTMTIAIVPIEAGSSGEEFYASGMTGEIGSRLPEMGDLTLVAPQSTEKLAEAGVEPLEIGRRLRADAVIAGKLLHRGDEVVLSLALYSVTEGRRTWSGQLRSPASRANDLPDRAVESLRRTLELTVPAAARVGGIKSSNYSLYLVAQGMLRTRDQEQIKAAESMLVALTTAEPHFAKGWAALAKAVALGRGMRIYPNSDSALADARRFSARALALDANSPEALAVAGLLASRPSEGQRLLEKSIAIAPNNAEAWLWLSNAYVMQGMDRKALDAMVRQLMIDPLWERSVQSPDAAATMGETALADRLDREVMRVAVEGWQRDLALARIARRHGDWSTYLRLSRTASLAAPPGQRAELDRSVMTARAYLGLPFGPANSRPLGMIGFRVMRGETPTLSEIRSAGLSEGQMFYEGTCLASMPRTLVKQGRTRELLAHFDGSIGTVDKLVAPPSVVDRQFGFESVPYLAMAMKAEGRTQQFGQLRRHFQPKMEKVASGAHATHLDVVIGLARLAAVFDNPELARKLLLRARAMGWPNSLPLFTPALTAPLSRDPAFAIFRGEDWFEDLSGKIEAERARERRAASDLASL